MSDILNVEISLQIPYCCCCCCFFICNFFTWTDLVHFSSPPYTHDMVKSFYHVAQLPIGSLRISNIRSKSKSEYPVTKLFKNAQP